MPDVAAGRAKNKYPQNPGLRGYSLSIVVFNLESNVHATVQLANPKSTTGMICRYLEKYPDELTFTLLMSADNCRLKSILYRLFNFLFRQKSRMIPYLDAPLV